MLTVVNSIGTTGGHSDSTNGYIAAALSESNQNPAVGNGPDAQRAAVRWNVKYGGVTSLNNDVDSPRLTQEEMNAHGPKGAKRAIRAGIDSIEHGSFLDDEGLKLMVAKGTDYVPILMAYEGVREGIAGGRRRLPPRPQRRRIPPPRRPRHEAPRRPESRHQRHRRYPPNRKGLLRHESKHRLPQRPRR